MTVVKQIQTNIMNKKLFFGLFFCLAIIIPGNAISLSEMFGEGMVLQYGKDTRIYGSGEPGELVTVGMPEIKSVSCITGKDGQWSVALKMPKPGGPYTLTVSGNKSNVITLNDVYVGDVWLAGGQSNMYFQMRNLQNWDQYTSTANKYQVRIARIPLPDYFNPSKKNDVKWEAATGKALEWNTAVGYLFAMELYRELKYPVGIISCNKGSTSAESWTPREELLKSPVLAARVKDYDQKMLGYKPGEYEAKLKNYFVKREEYNKAVSVGANNINKPSEPFGPAHPSWPGGLYQSMLERVIPMSLKGVIWYQGEANSTRPSEYEELMTILIQSWRDSFRNPKLPFYFVQLSNYDTPHPWPELREAQTKLSHKVPYTGMVVSIDCGLKNNIHPTDKEPVGKRLAAMALAKTYGRKIPHLSPEVKRVKLTDEGVEICFANADQGLTFKGKELKGFTICGSDSVFYPVKAIIKKNKVIVRPEKAEKPVSVRYGWASWTDANLTNRAGFPAIPFRCAIR